MTDSTFEFDPIPPAPSPDISRVRAEVQQVVGGDLSIESIQTPRDVRRDGILVMRGRLLRPSQEVFPIWLDKLNRLSYTPFLRPASDPDQQGVALHIVNGVAPKAYPRVWINIVLFVVTVISTLFVGSLYGATELVIETPWDLLRPSNLIQGWPFAATLLGILAAHEFGHYFVARYHKVAVTLPYFIPMPLGFGTLGAFIQLKAPVPDRRKLFDIGVAGPLAGLVLAIPLLFLGLSTSPVGVMTGGGMLEGNSVFYYLAKVAVFGQALPNPATGQDVFMNQVTFAAWIGLLVTALNLLPVGQLDGGHTVYALFGDKARYANMATAALMLVLAIAGLPPLQQVFPALLSVGYSGWFIWLGLIFFVIGPFHPPALDDVSRLDARRRWLGYLIIVIFLLTFVPVPMRPI